MRKLFDKVDNYLKINLKVIIFIDVASRDSTLLLRIGVIVQKDTVNTWMKEIERQNDNVESVNHVEEKIVNFFKVGIVIIW